MPSLAQNFCHQTDSFRGGTMTPLIVVNVDNRSSQAGFDESEGDNDFDTTVLGSRMMFIMLFIIVPAVNYQQ